MSLLGITNVGEIVRSGQRPSLAERSISAWRNWERVMHRVLFGDKFRLCEEMGEKGAQMLKDHAARQVAEAAPPPELLQRASTSVLAKGPPSSDRASTLGVTDKRT